MRNTFIWVIKTFKKNKEKSIKRAAWVDGNVDSITLNSDQDGFVMKMSGGAEMPWTPSSEDIFADDWQLA